MREALAALDRPQARPDLPAQHWLDGLTCDLLETGALARLVAAGLHGVTSNPATLVHAIRSHPSYQAVLPLLRASYSATQDRLDALLLPELRRACDLLAATYEGNGARAGFVSVDLSPLLAHDAAGTVAAARKRHASVARPNLLVKVPATESGIAAVEHLTFEGIGVNATLVFTPRQAAAVRAAQRRGLARRLQATQSIQRIACVITMPLGQINGAVDAQLGVGAESLRGSAAAASARLALRDLTGDTGFGVFAAFGAAPPLLALSDASSGLVLPGTVQLANAAALESFEGSPTWQVDTDAAGTVAQLARHGIDLETIGNAALAAALTQLRQTQRNLLALMG